MHGERTLICDPLPDIYFLVFGETGGLSSSGCSSPTPLVWGRGVVGGLGKSGIGEVFLPIRIGGGVADVGGDPSREVFDEPQPLGCLGGVGGSGWSGGGPEGPGCDMMKACC